MAQPDTRVARAGYVPHVFAYRGRGPLEGNVARLARFARAALDGRQAHFVGHSLGGVLILETLNAHPELQVASAILLGAPARGCLAGRRLGSAHLGRWMMGATLVRVRRPRCVCAMKCWRSCRTTCAIHSARS